MTATSVAPASWPGGRASTLVLVHEDATCIVLDKPAGLLAVPGRGADKADCLASRARQHWPEACVVHRLDMATSGLCLLARGLHWQRAFSRLFETRAVEKDYVAVVDGTPQPQPDADGWSAIDLPLAADWPRRPLQKVDATTGRPSLTRWRVLGPGAAAGTTRLALRPVTGRTHQLRVHLLAIGHPILGDALYAPPAVQARANRLLLHAAALRLPHPDGSGWLELAATVPF